MQNPRLAPDSNQTRQDFQLSHGHMGRSVVAVIIGERPMAVQPVHGGWVPRDRVRCHSATDSAGHQHRQLEWERRHEQGSQGDTDRSPVRPARGPGHSGTAGPCQGASVRITNTKTQRWTRSPGWGHSHHFLSSQPCEIDVVDSHFTDVEAEAPGSKPCDKC